MQSRPGESPGASQANVNGWLATADMPPWTPPRMLFGPVWTVLYVAMTVAAWLVWRRGAALTSWPLKLYWGQLARNPQRVGRSQQLIRFSTPPR